MLRPRAGASQLPLKRVDLDTALLFLTLAQPGPLPAYVGARYGTSVARDIARLVADGVLEVDDGSGFTSGAAALARGTSGVAGANTGVLSRAALQYAQALPSADAGTISARLYTYNTLPLTPSRKRLDDEAIYARCVGICEGAPAARLLETAWTRTAAVDGWLGWQRKRAMPIAERVAYKLYISPLPDALGEGGFATIVSALGATRAHHFKLGAGARGLLRPDKLVAYFFDFESLHEAARVLREHAGDMPAQGVPFTTRAGDGALLSWAVDRHESWRSWLCPRLAHALVAAASAGASQPWRFALERIALEGVDTAAWL